MVVTAETLITGAAVLAALISFGTIFVKIHRWIIKQEAQDEEIREIKKYAEDKFTELDQKIEKNVLLITKHHDDDVDHILTGTRNEFVEIKSELQLLTRSVLACLKGLREKGADGPVVEAIADIEKHLLASAHDNSKILSKE